MRTFSRTCLLVLTLVPPAAAQEGLPPAMVRYTQAREGTAQATLTLTGTVESRSSSVVAASVAGVVASLGAREGDSVRKGGVLVQLDQAPILLRLEAARGQLEEAEARLRLAEANRTRVQGLYEEQIVSRQQLDDAESEFEAWAGRRSQLEADVRRYELELDKSVIRAPFSGVVVQERTAVGEWLVVGEAAVEMVDPSALEVTVEVPERSYSGVARGTHVTLRFQALPGMTVTGKVRAVVPQADRRSRAFPVKITVENPHGRIGVGMLAEVELAIGSGEQRVMVPKDAVVPGEGGAIVFVIDGEERAQRVIVKTGEARGEWIGIEGDIEPGDRVVTRGNERLQTGQQVVGESLEYGDP